MDAKGQQAVAKQLQKHRQALRKELIEVKRQMRKLGQEMVQIEDRILSLSQAHRRVA